MSSIYPSLEDMKFHQLTIAQNEFYTKQQSANRNSYAAPVEALSHPPLPSAPPIYQEVAPSAPPVPNYATLSSNSFYPVLSSTQVSPNHSTRSCSAIQTNTTEFNNQRKYSELYPSLENYMGIELAGDILNACTRENESNLSILHEQENQLAINQAISNINNTSNVRNMIAPLSAATRGFHKAHVTNGIRELKLCKDERGLIGLRVCAISEGVFVCLVENNSPAALVGLRFGDQILQINDENVAGFNMKQVHKLLKNCPVNNIQVVVRDRPFERNVTLHKDSLGHFGFHFKNGQIFKLVKDSSATRNGLLIDHQILEVNGQNVVGLKDKQLRDLIEKCDATITLTIMPSFVFDHMMKKMSFNLVKEKMDHSI